MTVRGKFGLVQSLTFVNKQIAQRYAASGRGRSDYRSVERPERREPEQVYGAASFYAFLCNKRFQWSTQIRSLHFSRATVVHFHIALFAYVVGSV